MTLSHSADESYNTIKMFEILGFKCVSGTNGQRHMLKLQTNRGRDASGLWKRRELLE